MEWFIEKFTIGASFWRQDHRKGKRMDPFRITIHLMKLVGKRHQNAEVDRVWETSQGLFAPTITSVLECKWGLILKRHVDDFFEVLRQRKEFGTDSPDGRVIKQGIAGLFAGTTFNPRDLVTLKDGQKITLADYAARNNIKLLKAAEFNEQLQKKGANKETLP